MDQSATHMIREDHRKVAQLYHRYQGMGGQAAEKQALVEQICHELEVHAAIEEGIFYPAVRAALGTDSDELVDEALKEHGEMKKLIDKVRAGAVDDPAGGQLMQTLMQNVQHHVQEEESRMLPQAEQRLGEELDRVGARMRQRKQEALSSRAATE